jgi:hypothetical protein
MWRAVLINVTDPEFETDRTDGVTVDQAGLRYQAAA